MAELREFDWDEYPAAIAYLEELSGRGVERTLVERWGGSGRWIPWLAGAPGLAIYALARAQEIPERPRVRVGPVEKGPEVDVRLMQYGDPFGQTVTSLTSPHAGQRMKIPLTVPSSAP